MPKQILDLQNKIFQSAKVILEKEGYDALSMRKVAGACSIAVGTVYNYVRGKDELVAQVIMEDWVAALERMAQTTKECVSVADGMCGIYQALMAFIEKYQGIWTQYSQAGGSSNAIASHHMMLRGQIAVQIQSVLGRFEETNLERFAPLLAELVLAAAMQPDMDEDLVRDFTERFLD
ncbi:MAG: TetR/AcrR family transcriptional regulator [Ruminococcus sp.]|nr:TetR/AcrR family transcriptional regulator [Ruminococcus sp.]